MDANASSQLLTNEENRKINDLIQGSQNHTAMILGGRVPQKTRIK